MKQHLIYADNSATTSLAPEALEAMLPFLRECYGNPSSLHSAGVKARQAVANARSEIAEAINAEPEEIFFTSGGTESDNWALNIGATYGHILTTRIEHHAILNTCNALKARGVKVRYLPVNEDGTLKEDKIAHYIAYRPGLVSVMLANNELGTIQNLDLLSCLATELRILFHTDAVQAMGHIPVNVQAIGVDMLSASAHKFNGPKGIGFLYLRKGIMAKPLICGGHQEFGLRAGTENVAGIVGMATALKLNLTNLQANTQHLNCVAKTFVDAIREKVPDAYFNGNLENRLPGHISLSLPDIQAEGLLHYLDLKGIAISTGAACNSVSTKISHVLKAVKAPYPRGTIRISFGKQNTTAEALTIAQTIADYVTKVIPVQ